MTFGSGAPSVTAIVLARHNDGVPFVIERLSSAGARLVGPLAVSVGESIQILLDIDGRPLDLRAEVVDVSRDQLLSDRIAVRFVDIEDEAADAIRDAIEQQPSLLGFDE
jgi:hypothetical protein